jgi:hypothetical protein
MKSMVHEKSQEQDDRKRDTNQPEQSASTKAHRSLLSFGFAWLSTPALSLSSNLQAPTFSDWTGWPVEA